MAPQPMLETRNTTVQDACPTPAPTMVTADPPQPSVAPAAEDLPGRSVDHQACGSNSTPNPVGGEVILLAIYDRHISLL